MVQTSLGNEGGNAYCGAYELSGRSGFEASLKGLKDTEIYTLEDYDATGDLYNRIQELGIFFKGGRFMRNLTSHFTHSYTLKDKDGNIVGILGLTPHHTMERVNTILQ